MNEELSSNGGDPSPDDQPEPIAKAILIGVDSDDTFVFKVVRGNLTYGQMLRYLAEAQMMIETEVMIERLKAESKQAKILRPKPGQRF